ncbi:hypothetical protein S245_058219 [Arachis hypogaea]
MDEEEEEEKDEKAVLEQVFGPSSSSSSSSEEEEEEEEKLQWVAIEQVKGLWICTNFLSHRHQTHLLSAINSHNWFTPTTNNNQAMLFGHLPPWAHHLSHLIRTSSASILPQPLLSREPFFDQMIVNMYLPGQGEARYQWKHQINRNPGFQLWQGNELEQSRRISITLRKLCPDP